MSVGVIAFDGDDTLWHSESLFAVTHQRFRDLLAPYVDGPVVEERLLAAERANLAVFGYGVKGFTLSMIETAIDLTHGDIPARDLAVIVDWGKAMISHPVELLEGVEETVAELDEAGHRLALVTKGDLLHQESKLAGSGLGERFDHVAIVSEKDEATYRRVARDLGVAPGELLMVGNSVRSDVLPVVAIGGRAAHIPYHLTWALEAAPLPEGGAAARHVELSDIRQLPALVAELDR